MNNFEKLINLYQGRMAASNDPLESAEFENKIITFLNSMTEKELLNNLRDMDDENITIRHCMTKFFTNNHPRIFKVWTNKLKEHPDFILDNFLFVSHMEKSHLDYFIDKIPDFFNREFKKNFYKEKKVFDSIMKIQMRYESEMAFSLYKENIHKFSEEQKITFKNLVTENITALRDKGRLNMVFEYPEWHKITHLKSKKDIISLYLEKHDSDKDITFILEKIEENTEYKNIIKERVPALFNEINLYTHNIDLLKKAYAFSDYDKIKAWSHNPRTIGRKEWLSREVKSILTNMIENFGIETLIHSQVQHQDLFAKYLNLSKPNNPQVAFITNLLEIKNYDMDFLKSEKLKNEFLLVAFIYGKKDIEITCFESFMKNNDKEGFKFSHYQKSLESHDKYGVFMSAWDKIILNETFVNTEIRNTTPKRI